MFNNRKDAAEQLAIHLEKFIGENLLILCIPNGGVETAYYVAKHLNVPMVPVVSRKLGFPQNPDTAFGAIAEDGSIYISTTAYKHLTSEEIRHILSKEQKEISYFVEVYRNGNPLPDMVDKTVIIVDDGVATGSTMYVTIDLCKRANAARTIVATPVASERMKTMLSPKADEVIILETFSYFPAVSDGYEEFRSVPEKKVLEYIAELEMIQH